MAENELDSFLKSGAADEPAPVEQVEPEPVEETPEPTPPEAPPEPEEAEPQSPDGRTVPLSVLQAQRKDHKERAARLEGERDALMRQLEELKKAQQVPQQASQQPQAAPWINPAEDPVAYHNRMQEILYHQELNNRLNASEIAARRAVGAEKLNAAVAAFKEAAAEDPGLMQKLYQQPDPYDWMLNEVDDLGEKREFNKDRKAYLARKQTEWEAEFAAKSTPQPEAPLMAAPARVVPNLQPSLATARSAAPRSAASYSGPAPLEDILRR